MLPCVSLEISRLKCVEMNIYLFSDTTYLLSCAWKFMIRKTILLAVNVG